MRISDWSSDVCSSDLAPGMVLLIAAGERVPVDGRVVSGTSDLDCALVTGESAPRAVTPGAELQAGTLNLTGPLRIEATAAAEDSFLAEMVRLMQAAEAGRSAYRRIADRASRLYRSDEHTSELQSLLRISSAVFCLKTQNLLIN